MGKKNKESQEGINSKIALVMKSGKSVLGFKSTMKAIRSGKAKLVFISSNCPTIRKSQVQYYAMLGHVKIYLFSGNNAALGTTCGKLFNVSTFAVLDAGDSDILTAE